MASKRVLVVDDEAFICTTVSILLRLEGFAVSSASDGRAGLQAALDNPPDVILSDVNMPHMNGYQLLAAVRDSPSLAATKVVMLTGEEALSTSQPGGDAPDAFLAKPFTRERLLGLLRSFDG